MKKHLLLIFFLSLPFEFYSMDTQPSLLGAAHKTIVKDIVNLLKQREKEKLATKLNQLTTLLPQELIELINIEDQIASTLYNKLSEARPLTIDSAKNDIIQMVKTLPADWQERLKERFVWVYADCLAAKPWGPFRCGSLTDDVERFDGQLRYRDNIDPRDPFGFHISRWKETSFEYLLDVFIDRLKSSPYFKE